MYLTVQLGEAQACVPAILGINVQLKTGGKLDVSWLQLLCGGRTLPLQAEQTEPSVRWILVDQTRMVLGGQEVLVLGKIEG